LGGFENAELLVSNPLSQEQILETLKTIPFPKLSRDIVSFGLIKGIEINGDVVRVQVRVSSRDQNVPVQIEQDISREVGTLTGVREVQVDMSWVQPDAPPPTPNQAAHQVPGGSDDLLPGVRFKIAVASGKGGVGKSTVAAGLALMLHRSGYKVGLVDFDIYGPSVPTIFGVHEQPHAVDNKILPLDRDGLKLMSMGFLVDPGTPMIWRGPMVHQATEQFLRDVLWGDLDVLIVDLPPGTGDAQMTLSQKVALDGAVIVSTPQDLALIDARKGAAMFEKMNVPILGIVENMSGFTCPHCGQTTDIFGRGGAEHEAKLLNVPLLARIPIIPAIVSAGDRGDPMMAIESDKNLSAAFSELANKVCEAAGITVAR
jgi:ATP-binding protein involved in chromosome partitioning